MLIFTPLLAFLLFLTADPAAVAAPLPPDSLGARFAQRLVVRDALPPPPSQEPEAILARVQAWLTPPEGVRDARTLVRLARMLMALMEHTELDTYQLQAAAGLSWRAGTRMSVELLARGLTERERRGRFFYHRLTRAAEDALLVVVAGAGGRAVRASGNGCRPEACE